MNKENPSPPWTPEIPQNSTEISLESQGGIARAIWNEKFRSLQTEIFSNPLSEVLFTDIGGGVAQEKIPWTIQKNDSATGVKIYGDGTEIPPYIDLELKYKQIPRALFLVASPQTTDQVLSLLSVAEEYKRQGVDYIFPVMATLAHERQDHHFNDSDGNPIYQAETLQTLISVMARSRFIDGGLLLQPHSMQPIRLGTMEGLTLLPIDGLQLMVEKSGVKSVVNPFVIGADKGRKDTARDLASLLQCPYGVCKKTRARTTNGLPELDIPLEVLRYIKENNCSVVVFDDEIREGGTTAALRQKFSGWANRFYMYAFKGFFAYLNGHGKSAAEALAVELDHPYEEELITVTDAVKPILPVDPIQHKLKVIKLRPDIENLILYLQQNPVPKDGDLNWLRNPQATNTMLQLNLINEKYV